MVSVASVRDKRKSVDAEDMEKEDAIDKERKGNKKAKGSKKKKSRRS